MNEIIPPPFGAQCPNCGQVLETPQALCPRCGARIDPAKRGPGAWRVVGAIILLLAALFSGAVGGCALFIIVVTVSGGNWGEGNMIYPIVGIGGMLLAVFLFIMAVRLLSKR